MSTIQSICPVRSQPVIIKVGTFKRINTVCHFLWLKTVLNNLRERERERERERDSVTNLHIPSEALFFQNVSHTLCFAWNIYVFMSRVFIPRL